MWGDNNALPHSIRKTSSTVIFQWCAVACCGFLYFLSCFTRRAIMCCYAVASSSDLLVVEAVSWPTKQSNKGCRNDLFWHVHQKGNLVLEPMLQKSKKDKENSCVGKGHVFSMSWILRTLAQFQNWHDDFLTEWFPLTAWCPGFFTKNQSNFGKMTLEVTWEWLPRYGQLSMKKLPAGLNMGHLIPIHGH